MLPKGEGGYSPPPMYFVCIIESVGSPGRHYTGLSKNYVARLISHNQGRSRHTRKYLPWKLNAAIAVVEKSKAVALENYLKSGSGRAFAKKHF